MIAPFGSGEICNYSNQCVSRMIQIVFPYYNLFLPIEHIVLRPGTECFNRMKHIAGKYVSEKSKGRMYQLV